MEFQPIPGPRGLPFLGNAYDVQSDEAPLRAFEMLADTYGDVYELHLGGTRSLNVSSAAMMREVLDEKTFTKNGLAGLTRPGRPAGLFPAATADPDWGQAHRILMPAFGPLAIEGMFDDMKDLANQLVLKWARKGSDYEIQVTDDYTRLTLDTIAACTMDYRFNSFYQDAMHPFVAAMVHTLTSAGERGKRPKVVNMAMYMLGQFKSTEESADYMQKVAREIVDQRRSVPVDKHDLMDTMLNGKDPKTGQVMRDDLIVAQMLVFLIAGHETTSGLLSFATMCLLQNPETLAKAKEEVDRVVGRDALQLKHLKQLKYVNAVLRETLRLFPTAPRITKSTHPDKHGEVVTLGGKYKIEPEHRIIVLLGKCMQDPRVWGEDAKEFKPERLHEDNPDFQELQQYWKPFGHGMRACIGRSFALQEAVIGLTLVIQNFDFRLTDPSYKLRIKQNLTIKPSDLTMKATLRHGMSPVDLDKALHAGQPAEAQIKQQVSTNGSMATSANSSMAIMFGSNAGTCQSLAQRLAAEASSSRGYYPEVRDMDAFLGRLSKDRPNVIITASYEGEPTDNALQFVQWLQCLTGKELEGVKFAVFGCGHKDWQATFHRVPRLVDSLMIERGAERISELGLADVSDGNTMTDFETWLDNQFWPDLQKLSPDKIEAVPVKEAEAEISMTERSTTLQQDLNVGTVKEVTVLTAPGEPPKHHMEIALPETSVYECGDYLAVLPQSPEAVVREIMAHFKLPLDATISLKSDAFKPLPLDTSLSVAELLRDYYELSKPISRRGLTFCIQNTPDGEAVKAHLERLLDDRDLFRSELTVPRKSMMDVLKKHPQIDLPFPTFLSLLPPLSIRQYSISSSPLHRVDACTITYGVVSSQPAADGERPFYGTATTYLSALKPGDRVQVSTRRTAKQAFRLPLDSEKTPLLMFCAGTGLAPFRGFIQQRAIQLEANPATKLAPAHLFIGCRSETADRLYAKELDEWASKGAVKLYYAFSREPEKSDGCKYVSGRLVKEKDVIVDAWRAGARAYTCGNRVFMEGVREATKEVVRLRAEERRKLGATEEQIDEMQNKFVGAVKERAADDIFD